MKDFIRPYSMSKKAVEEEFKPEWNATVYRIGGKIFVMWGEYKDGRPLLTVKLEPALSEILRAKYPGDVIPGYYTNKTHWSSLFLDSAVSDDIIYTMLDNGYETTLSSLSAKARAAIRGD